MHRDKKYIHPKTIIHIEIDDFFSQVKPMIEPRLGIKPVGVKRKNIIVAHNSVASKSAIKESMLVTEALKLCPSLVILNCDDLREYQQASNQIYSFLLSFTNEVVRLGFDENYLDVTELVSEKERNADFLNEFVGHRIQEPSKSCPCGCHKRLAIGSQIAFEIRKRLKREFDFTSCCGISYNELLAKISCSAHKPNQQTTLLPGEANRFSMRFDEIDLFPRMEAKINDSKSVRNLEKDKFRKLENSFNSEEGFINLISSGREGCSNQVKSADARDSLWLDGEIKRDRGEFIVKEKFRILLHRLLILMENSGRIPRAVKVMVRKQEANDRTACKETKQSPLPGHLFAQSRNKLSQISINKVLDIIMRLFSKIVNKARPFHITLLGLAFSKFIEKSINCSVASFLLTKGDLSIQSLTNLTSDEKYLSEPSDVNMDCCSESESESEREHYAKRTKLEV